MFFLDKKIICVVCYLGSCAPHLSQVRSNEIVFLAWLIFLLKSTTEEKKANQQSFYVEKVEMTHIVEGGGVLLFVLLWRIACEDWYVTHPYCRSSWGLSKYIDIS